MPELQVHVRGIGVALRVLPRLDRAPPLPDLRSQHRLAVSVRGAVVTTSRRSIRRARAVRSKALPAVVTERDLLILTFLGLVRYATSHQVARALEFPSVDRCLRRLRVLFDLGYAVNTYRDSRQPNLVSATRAGLAAVVALRPECEGRLQTAGPIRGPAIAHALAVVDARIYAERFGRAFAAPLLAWHGPRSAEVERRLGTTIRPDGLAIFGTPTAPMAIAIEVDCGTEGAKVLAAKLTAYGTVFRRTPPGLGECWLIATGASRRLELLATLVQEARLHHVVRLMPLATITTATVTPLAPLVAKRPASVFDVLDTPKDAARRGPLPPGDPAPTSLTPDAVCTPVRGGAW